MLDTWHFTWCQGVTMPKAGRPRIEPGSTVYSVSDCGDFYEGRSVVIPAGTRGILLRYFDRYGDPPQATERMAEVSIPESPGQKILRTRASDLHVFWRLRVKTSWERILLDVGP